MISHTECMVEGPHGHMPSWLQPGSADWQKQVARLGEGEMMRNRNAYLTGFTDVEGNHWCGQCYWRCRFVGLGHQLNYPPLRMYALKGGYDAWLSYAREASVVGIADAVRYAERLLAHDGKGVHR